MSDARNRSPVVETVLVLTGLTVIALALRLPSFGDSLWADEVSTNYVINGFGVDNVLGLILTDQENTPPLFYLLTWLTKGFGGVEGLRVISLLAGLAAIPLTYLLGERTVGRPAGLVGATLVALSPFQIFYATEARAYALMMLCCLLAALTLVIALESGRSRWWWVAYGLSVAAAAYTHYTSVFVLIALFGWAFLARPEARKPLFLANLGAALLFAPWLPEAIADSNEPTSKFLDLFHPMTFESATTDLGLWALGHPFIPLGEILAPPALWLVVLALLLGVAGLLSRGGPAQKQGRRLWPPPAGLVLVVVVALAAPVGAVVWSLIGQTIFLPRNLIGSWPAYALALGALVTAGGKPLRLAATGLLLAGFAIGAVRMLDADNQRPDLAAAVEFIERTGEPGSPVVDMPQPGSGPQTPLEAAFTPKGQPYAEGRTIMTLTLPTLASQLKRRREGGGFFQLDPSTFPSAEQIARRASRIAGDGTLFLVTPDRVPFDQLRDHPGEVASFLAALPSRFHGVEYRTYPGFSDNPVSVYVLEGGG